MTGSSEEKAVPQALRNWFVVHFVADTLFAVPLMIAPAWLLGLFGWQQVDPYTARVVAAALFGIGIESLLGRKAGVESFRNMLNLKIIWSLAVLVGIVWSWGEGAQGNPPMVWALFGIFAGFNLLWVYWRWKLSR